MSKSPTRLGSLALAAAATLFILYPALRPWHDEATVDGASQSMSSNAWVAAHFCAMLGFILLPLGLLAVVRALRGTRVQSLALAATVVTWIGAGLTLPYYGAEDFGLHAIASHHTADLLSLIKGIRYQPLAITIFTLGLLLLGIGAVLAAVAIWRSGVLVRVSGVVYAVAFALFIPQFSAPAAGRIAHGVLVGLGLGLLAWGLERAKSPLRSDGAGS